MENAMPTHANDELEIMRLLARLAQAVDDRDADAYRDCFADEVVCMVPDTDAKKIWRAVPSEAYARQAVASVSSFEWTHHGLCNFVIVADGERAQGKVDVVVQMQGPTTNEGGTPPMLLVGGRYDLEFRKLATGWRITKRHMKTRYTSRNPPTVARAGVPHHA
jgi:3-phenylpropionate/cinnamic acid dioxygenase small subunit